MQFLFQEITLMNAPLPILTTVGLGFLRLGDDESQVRQLLSDNELELADSHDPYCLESSDFTVQMVFDLSKHLVQIVVDSTLATINGESLEGSTLDEALHVCGVRSFSDTLWSGVDIDSEYSKGVPVPDEKRPQECDQTILLDGGTLWIKSMGLGLNMAHGEIDSIAIRKPESVPKIGCGPLSREAIVQAGDSDLKEKLDSRRGKANTYQQTANRSKSLFARAAMFLIAIGLVVVPGYLMYVKHRAWANATPVHGTIVETKMDGPFVVGLKVEYGLPDEKQASVEVNPNYTTSREVGETVELVYLEGAPEKAITPREARDAFLSGYLPYFAVLGPIFAIGLLAWCRS